MGTTNVFMICCTIIAAVAAATKEPQLTFFSLYLNALNKPQPNSNTFMYYTHVQTDTDTDTDTINPISRHLHWIYRSLSWEYERERNYFINILIWFTSGCCQCKTLTERDTRIYFIFICKLIFQNRMFTTKLPKQFTTLQCTIDNWFKIYFQSVNTWIQLKISRKGLLYSTH